MKKKLLLIKWIFLGTVWRKRILFAFLGGIAGYAYYYYIGCASGTCPISSNPWYSTIYGTAAGLILTISEKKKESTKGN